MPPGKVLEYDWWPQGAFGGIVLGHLEAAFYFKSAFEYTVSLAPAIAFQCMGLLRGFWDGEGGRGLQVWAVGIGESWRLFTCN